MSLPASGRCCGKFPRCPLMGKKSSRDIYFSTPSHDKGLSIWLLSKLQANMEGSGFLFDPLMHRLLLAEGTLCPPDPLPSAWRNAFRAASLAPSSQTFNSKQSLTGMTYTCSTWHPQRWLKQRLDNPLSIQITHVAGKLMLAIGWQFGWSGAWEQGALLLLQVGFFQLLGLLHWMMVEFPEQRIQSKGGGTFTLSLEITQYSFHCSLLVERIPKFHSG